MPMNAKYTCPNCGVPAISKLRKLLALRPFYTTCPNCHARLRLVEKGWQSVLSNLIGILFFWYILLQSGTLLHVGIAFGVLLGLAGFFLVVLIPGYFGELRAIEKGRTGGAPHGT